MKNKRLFRLVSVLVLIALVLAGCSKPCPDCPEGEAQALPYLRADKVLVRHEMLNLGYSTIGDGEPDTAQAEGSEGLYVEGPVEIDGATDLDGALDVDTIGAISLDADLASNFTVSGATIDLTLESEDGRLIIKAGEAIATAIELDANATVTTGITALVGSVSGFAIAGGPLSVGDNDIDNVTDIALDTISADNATSFSISDDWTNAGNTIADLGVVTTADTNGGTIDGTIIGGSTTAAGSFTTIDASGITELDGGFTVDDTAFSVADATGNTVISGTLHVRDTVDIDDLVDITRVTGETGQYEDLIQAEWTNSAADGNFGSNGIYVITNPIFDVSNVYGLRARLDLTDATGAVDVNQLHGIDALINLNETEIYTLTDNISAIGVAIHGGNMGDVVVDAEADPGSMNLYYGVYGPTATVNHTVQTNGMLLMMHPATYVDYGVQIQSSADMDAGVYLNSHASDGTAKMDVGVEMVSGASDMIDGINMEAADFTGDDIVLDEGGTINNSSSGVVQISAFFALSEGAVQVMTYGATLTCVASFQPITSTAVITNVVIADGTVAGQIVIISNENAADDITILESGSNLQAGGDVVLGGGDKDAVTLLWDGTEWIRIAFFDN